LGVLVGNRIRLLTSPVFIAVLGLLLLNDFLLKRLFHNWLTGKLSDFSGLFIFPLLFSVWIPRYKAWIYLSTAAGFMFWKSTYSQPLIDTINTVSAIRISRMAGMTDLIALSVLPVSWRCRPVNLPLRELQVKPMRPILAVAVSALCVFAFAATTTVEPEQVVVYDKDYQFELSREELVDRLSRLSLRSFSVEERVGADKEDGQLYKGRLDKDVCDSAGGRAEMKIYSRGTKSTLRLQTIKYNCSARLQDDATNLLEEFESRVTERLRAAK
jgi:hypothetical protein